MPVILRYSNDIKKEHVPYINKEAKVVSVEPSKRGEAMRIIVEVDSLEITWSGGIEIDIGRG